MDAYTYISLRDTKELLGSDYRRELIVQDNIHAYVHAGILFDVSGDGSIANGASVYFMARVNGTNLHFNDFALDVSSGAARIEFFEAPTISAVGTPITPVNKNRSSTNTAKSLIYFNPTITNDGTLLASRVILESGVAGATGGTGGLTGEWILKKNTDYIIKITNNSGGTITYNSKFIFYEE